MALEILGRRAFRHPADLEIGDTAGWETCGPPGQNDGKLQDGSLLLDETTSRGVHQGGPGKKTPTSLGRTAKTFIWAGAGCWLVRLRQAGNKVISGKFQGGFGQVMVVEGG